MAKVRWRLILWITSFFLFWYGGWGLVHKETSSPCTLAKARVVDGCVDR